LQDYVLHTLAQQPPKMSEKLLMMGAMAAMASATSWTVTK